MRPKLTVATSFPVDPARGGGQLRVRGLYGELGRLGVEVDLVTLVEPGGRAGRTAIGPGLHEIRVPKSPEHDAAEHALSVRTGIPVTDIALGLHHHLTPAYGDAIEASARDATAVVACHPFPEPALRERSALPLLFEAQDVETDLKASMLDGREGAEELVAAVREFEAACCANSKLVLVCSRRDGDRLEELFGLDPGRVLVVPNGADTEKLAFSPLELRADRQRRLGLQDAGLTLFVGSWHEPNIVAARALLGAARERPETRFLVVGSVCSALAGDEIPPNVDLCGMVDDGFLHSVLGLAAVAVNPMALGSGTNLKMLDYCLAGVPVISSTFGARGLGLDPGEHYVAAEPAALGEAIARLLEEPAGSVGARVRRADELVRKRYSWASIAAGWLAHAAVQEVLAA